MQFPEIYLRMLYDFLCDIFGLCYNTVYVQSKLISLKNSLHLFLIVIGQTNPTFLGRRPFFRTLSSTHIINCLHWIQFDCFVVSFTVLPISRRTEFIDINNEPTFAMVLDCQVVFVFVLDVFLFSAVASLITKPFEDYSEFSKHWSHNLNKYYWHWDFKTLTKRFTSKTSNI